MSYGILGLIKEITFGILEKWETNPIRRAENNSKCKRTLAVKSCTAWKIRISFAPRSSKYSKPIDWVGKWM